MRRSKKFTLKISIDASVLKYWLLRSELGKGELQICGLPVEEAA